jgi:hypothetical protein
MPRKRGRGYGWPHLSDPFKPISARTSPAPRFCLTLTRLAQPCIRMHPLPLALVGAGARARWPALTHLFGIR